MNTPRIHNAPRRTKIVCTIGPDTDKNGHLRPLIEKGTNIFRLNMSHARHDWVRQVVPRIRQLAEEARVNVGILMDTQGPSIRTGELPTPIALQPGEQFVLRVRGAQSEEVRSVDVDYDNLINDIHVGDVVLIDNGAIHMEVLAKAAGLITCRVLTVGTLKSRKRINLPGVRVSLPALTDKDMADVALGAELGVDFFALSFVNESSDIAALRKKLEELDSKARVVAKIETQHAVKNLDAIIRVSDAVMVARGDLGIECPMEDLPIIQRRIVKHCIRLGTPVIVATHMLESMIENPLPTRAEVTDVANATYEQADALMLSGETAIGRYPVECVATLDRVTRRIERTGGAGYGKEVLLDSTRHKTVHSAVVLANSLPSSKILVFTLRGTMATYVSSMRPNHSPIFAFAPHIETVRKLAVNWGTEAFQLPLSNNPAETVNSAIQMLINSERVTSGDKLVIVSDVLSGEFVVDSIQLRTV